MFILFDAKCKIVKIYLEYIFDIFFIINGLCMSLLHIQYTFLYIFLLHYSNFTKMCARRCTQIMTYFFLLIDINLNYNVILYFFIILLTLYW
jgi:hypothetical protein